MPPPRRGAAAATLAALDGVSVHRGTRAVLDDVTLGVVDGARIGVVGRNGGGKTTLLRTLAGDLDPDVGRLRRPPGVTVGALAQEDDLPATATVRDVVVGDVPEHSWASDSRIRSVLTGLLGGVDASRYGDGWATTVATMSGGERRRVALAAVLVADPDLLLLDEPTNHLDVEGVAWLAEHLTARRGSVVVVTHDRWFLDAACTETWEVGDGTVHRYDGGYAAFVLARAERVRAAAVAGERRANLLRKELAWLRRGAPARTSKPRFRIDAAEALIADEPPPRDRLTLERLATARLGRSVVDLEDVTVAPARGAPPVVVGETWRLGPGDRVGLLGPNGAGKTTLLRLLAGSDAGEGDGPVVLAGVARVGVTVVPAMLTQRLAVGDPEDRVLASIERERTVVDVGRGRTLTARSLLEGFGFSGDRLMARLGDLSGGELRRWALLRLLVAGPNLLLLDEPTNDLDVETLTVLEDLLDTWPGTLVVVSHDRYFLERTTDTVFALLGDGAIRHLPGGVDEYLARRAAATTPPVTPGDPAPPGDGPRAGGPDRAAPRAGAPSAAETREARKELTRIERRLDRIAAAETDLHERLAAVATDHEQVLALDAALRSLTDERLALETRWWQVAELLE